jgi:transcriptional regulator with XRE-family HTH domain
MTGDELGELLRAIGWTSAELARRLSIRPDTVNSWLTGRRPVPGNVERWLHQVRAGFGSAPALPEGWRPGG